MAGAPTYAYQSATFQAAAAPALPWRIALTLGIGFLAIFYCLTAAETISTPLAYIYWPEVGNRTLSLTLVTYTCEIIGGLAIGMFADLNGRRNTYFLALKVCAVGSLGMTMASRGENGSMSIFAWIMTWRVLLSAAGSGVYSIVATMTAEYVAAPWRNVIFATVISSEYLAHMVVEIITMIAAEASNPGTRVAFNSQNTAASFRPHAREADTAWRSIVAIGIFLPIIAEVVFRFFKFPEPEQWINEVLYQDAPLDEQLLESGRVPSSRYARNTQMTGTTTTSFGNRASEFPHSIYIDPRQSPISPGLFRSVSDPVKSPRSIRSRRPDSHPLPPMYPRPFPAPAAPSEGVSPLDSQFLGQNPIPVDRAEPSPTSPSTAFRTSEHIPHLRSRAMINSMLQTNRLPSPLSTTTPEDKPPGRKDTMQSENDTLYRYPSGTFLNSPRTPKTGETAVYINGRAVDPSTLDPAILAAHEGSTGQMSLPPVTARRAGSNWPLPKALPLPSSLPFRRHSEGTIAPEQQYDTQIETAFTPRSHLKALLNEVKTLWRPLFSLALSSFLLSFTLTALGTYNPVLLRSAFAPKAYQSIFDVLHHNARNSILSLSLPLIIISLLWPLPLYFSITSSKSYLIYAQAAIAGTLGVLALGLVTMRDGSGAATIHVLAQVLILASGVHRLLYMYPSLLPSTPHRTTIHALITFISRLGAILGTLTFEASDFNVSTASTSSGRKELDTSMLGGTLFLCTAGWVLCAAGNWWVLPHVERKAEDHVGKTGKWKALEVDEVARVAKMKREDKVEGLKQVSLGWKERVLGRNSIWGRRSVRTV